MDSTDKNIDVSNEPLPESNVESTLNSDARTEHPDRENTSSADPKQATMQGRDASGKAGDTRSAATSKAMEHKTGKKKKSHLRESKYTIAAVVLIVILFAVAVIYLMNFLGIRDVKDVFGHLYGMVFNEEWRMWQNYHV